MSVATQANKLASTYTRVSSNYLGESDNFYQICREKRLRAPVYEGDFIAQFGIPTNAKIGNAHPTYAIFNHKDVMVVLEDAESFTSGFIAEGLGSFFDGLIIIAMDGDKHRRVRGLLQPVFMPETVLRWSEKISQVIRNQYLLPMLPDKRAELMNFGLNFPTRVIYALIGFPEDSPEEIERYASWAHMCIGQYVAKTELTQALNAIFDLLPNIRLDPERPAPKITGCQLRGAASVPVMWD